jgi:hypothetical protein
MEHLTVELVTLASGCTALGFFVGFLMSIVKASASRIRWRKGGGYT